MKIYYRLYEQDYLQHQLYIASKAPRIIKRRKNSYFWITVFFAIMSALFLILENNFMAIYTSLFTIATVIFYPMYERYRYMRHYKSFIKENYPDKPDENSSVEFTDVELIVSNDNSESKIKLSEIDKIVEIKDYFFIRIGPTSLIIPKERLKNTDEIRGYLEKLSKNISKEYVSEMNWKWR